MEFVGSVPIPEYKPAALGISDCPAVPGMDSAIGILPVAMDCEESAFTFGSCEDVKPEAAEGTREFPFRLKDGFAVTV